MNVRKIAEKESIIAVMGILEYSGVEIEMEKIFFFVIKESKVV